MKTSYKKALLKGVHGAILAKHHNLAKVLKNKKVSDAYEYCRRFNKYNDFTYRDIDKAVALVK